MFRHPCSDNPISIHILYMYTPYDLGETRNESNHKTARRADRGHHNPKMIPGAERDDPLSNTREVVDYCQRPWVW